ncbi:MAG TPA: hypothetical protein VKU41_01405 [Polyangiaceae bacterium]|nr:hypothetical protein [Polyangiaceae bacterium]
MRPKSLTAAFALAVSAVGCAGAAAQPVGGGPPPDPSSDASTGSSGGGGFSSGSDGTSGSSGSLQPSSGSGTSSGTLPVIDAAIPGAPPAGSSGGCSVVHAGRERPALDVALALLGAVALARRKRGATRAADAR